MRRLDRNVAELARRGGYAARMTRSAAVSILATDLMAYASGGNYVGQRVRLFALQCAITGVGGSQPEDEYDEEGA